MRRWRRWGCWPPAAQQEGRGGLTAEEERQLDNAAAMLDDNMIDVSPDSLVANEAELEAIDAEAERRDGQRGRKRAVADADPAGAPSEPTKERAGERAPRPFLLLSLGPDLEVHAAHAAAAGMPPAAGLSSGSSLTAASVVMSRPATEAASWSAVRTTLVGSITPAWTRFS